MIGERIGSYKVMRKLGEGGMGAVYEAVHEQIERRAAIKVLHPNFSKEPEFAKRFFNEARAVNIVQHSGLVQIHEVGQMPDGTAYIIMEYLEGETLSARLKRCGGKLGLEGLQVIRQVASALTATHAKGIIHRDLKPANIIVVPEPEAPGGERAKVLDFGVAKLTEAHPKDGDEPMTKSGSLFGTPTYMAPEQCRGAGTVDGKADVYSLGVMLYQILGGRPPFVGGEGEVLGMHLYKKPPPLQELEPSVPEGLLQMVHRMLDKEPSGRPTMAEVAQELGRFGAMATGMWPALSGMMPVPSGMMPVPSGMMPVPSGGLVPLPAGGIAVPSGAAVVLPTGAVRLTGPSAVPQAGPSLAVDSGAMTPTPTAMGEAAALAQGAQGAQGGQPVSVARTPGSRRALYAGLAAAPVLLIAAVLLTRTPTPTVVPRPEPPRTQPVPVPPPRPPVRWAVVTDPPGAEVISDADGKVLGVTPWRTSRVASEGALSVTLRKAGFADRHVELNLSSDVSVQDTLHPVAAPKPEVKVGGGEAPGTKRPRVKPRPHTETEDVREEAIPLFK